MGEWLLSRDRLSSQARSAFPKGAGGLSQGFNPGNPQINEFALKGREADLIKLTPIAAPKLGCAIETCSD